MENKELEAAVADLRKELDELRELIRKLYPEGVKPVPPAEIVTRDVLFELGVPENLAGYQTIVQVVGWLLEHPGWTRRDIFTQIEHGKRDVSRNVKYAIELAWARGNIETQERICGEVINPRRGKPTATEFIFLVAAEVRRRLHREESTNGVHY